MPIYTYESKNIHGIILKGKIEAVDEKSVTLALREKNYYPVKIKEYKESMNVDLSDFKKISLKDISIFCRQFSVIISAGISIIRAIEIVKEQTENPKLKKILNSVNEEIQKGKTLSVAMREHKEMPDMLINMLEVGETSGTLDKIMRTMASYYEKEYKQQQKIKQAMTYPMVISIFALLVVTGLVVKVIPIFTGMITKSGGVIPTPTRLVVGISGFLRTKGLLLLLIILFIVVIVKCNDKKNKNKFKNDSFKMKMPVFGKIYIKIITARFARTFGILMSSGVSLMQSIDICSQMLESKIIGDMLMSVKEEIKKGARMGDSLSSRKIFPVMLTQMIKIGEESGNLDEVLVKTADYYDDEVDVATAKMTTLIEPAIIIVLAVVVGFIIFSIILPIFSMYNSVGN